MHNFMTFKISGQLDKLSYFFVGKHNLCILLCSMNILYLEVDVIKTLYQILMTKHIQHDLKSQWKIFITRTMFTL